MNNKNKLIIIFAPLVLFSIFYFLFSIPVEAAEPLQLQVKFPCPDFPGAPCPTGAKEKAGESPAAYIARFYQFALALAGMLAFGMIIYGAIQYTVSAGNVAQQSDARDRIYQALWGVALLLGAYLILYTIDPGLVNLRDPKIELVKVPDWTAEEKAEMEKMKMPLGEQTPIKEGEKDIVKGDGIVEREIGGKLYRDTYQWVKRTSCKSPWFVTAQNECNTWGRLTPPFPKEEQLKWRCCQKREEIK